MTDSSSPDLYEINREELSRYYDRLVSPVFEDRFPAGFKLEPADWHLSREIVERRDVYHQDRYVRPIGTMDVEFLSDRIIEQAKVGELNLSRQYPCGLKCPGCFSEDATYADPSQFLNWREVFDVVDDAKQIGLASLKFLGPGELFQNPDLFKILDAAEERDLPLSIFTKGAELGDDELADYIYGDQGIHTATELVKRISGYSCVRILLGFNSFDPIKQDIMVGSNGITGHYRFREGAFVKRGVEKYTIKRNRALVNLVTAGFNTPTTGQRLSLIAAPVGLDQVDEIPAMYIWAARRNIPLVIAPTMESGPKAIGLMRSDMKRDPNHLKLKEMYLAVYTCAIREGIKTIADIECEGISAYMGTAACNQVANGVFLRLNGQVQMCPGTVTDPTVFGNIRHESLVDIWRNCSSYQLGRLSNNWCKAKINGLPNWLSIEVLSELKCQTVCT